MRILGYYYFNAPHIQKMEIEMRVICYYFINADYQSISSLVSFPWLHLFLHGASVLDSFIYSPPVPLGVMLDDQTYVDLMPCVHLS